MHILVVEDNLGDAHLMREALQEHEKDLRVNIITDGEQALAFLRQEGEYAGVSRPDLVFLDLRLPKKDGREVLSELKDDGRFGDMPIVVVTSVLSSAEQEELFALGGRRIINKPINLEEYFASMQEVLTWWKKGA